MAHLCPNCKTGLTKTDYDGLPVYRCNNCLGYLIGSKRVQVIEARDAQISEQLIEKAQSAGASDTRLSIKCPHCLARMAKEPYGDDGKFHLDVCKRCEMIWFDAGEIELIQIEHNQDVVPKRKTEQPSATENMTDEQRKSFEKRLAQICNNQPRSLNDLVRSLGRLS